MLNSARRDDDDRNDRSKEPKESKWRWNVTLQDAYSNGNQCRECAGDAGNNRDAAVCKPVIEQEHAGAADNSGDRRGGQDSASRRRAANRESNGDEERKRCRLACGDNQEGREATAGQPTQEVTTAPGEGGDHAEECADHGATQRMR